MSVLSVTSVPRSSKPGKEVSESRVDIHWKRLIKVVWGDWGTQNTTRNRPMLWLSLPSEENFVERAEDPLFSYPPRGASSGNAVPPAQTLSSSRNPVEGRYSAALGVGVQAAVWRGVVGLELCGPLDFLQCPHWKLNRQDDTFFNFYSKTCCLRHKGTTSQIRLFLQHTNHHDQRAKAWNNTATPTLLLQQGVLPLQIVDVLLVCVVFSSHVLDVLCGFV